MPDANIPEAAAETPSQAPDIDVAEAEPADLVPILVQLPRQAIDSLVDTGYLEPAARDDQAAVGGALLAYLSEAWIRGVREAVPQDDADVAHRKADYHRRLAAVNPDPT
jgi:hypothetical protein